MEDKYLGLSSTHHAQCPEDGEDSGCKLFLAFFTSLVCYKCEFENMNTQEVHVQKLIRKAKSVMSVCTCVPLSSLRSVKAKTGSKTTVWKTG